MSQLRVTLVKSLIGEQWRARRVVTGMGFTKLQQTRVFPDNPSVRGMIRRVRHLVTFEEVPGSEEAALSPNGATAPTALAAAPTAAPAAPTVEPSIPAVEPTAVSNVPAVEPVAVSNVPAVEPVAVSNVPAVEQTVAETAIEPEAVQWATVGPASPATPSAEPAATTEEVE